MNIDSLNVTDFLLWTLPATRRDTVSIAARYHLSGIGNSHPGNEVELGVSKVYRIIKRTKLPPFLITEPLYYLVIRVTAVYFMGMLSGYRNYSSLIACN
jgi:hypothetical protein